MNDPKTLIENSIFSEIEVGASASITRMLSQRDIELFAEVTGDVNPAHVDPDFARNDMFHKVIAHGLWGGGLISAVLGTKLPGPGTIYLSQSLRFLRPVTLGDTITATVTVTDKRPKHNILVLDCRCANQNGEDVITGEAEIMAPTEKVSVPRAVLPEVRVFDGPEGARITPIIDLRGKRGLIVGIANDQSIAAGCAASFRRAGARLAATYLNEKAKPFVAPVAEVLGADWIQPCDVREDGAVEALFDRVRQEWGELDFLLHSIAFAPREDLHGRVVDCTEEGFATAMSISCHSFIRMAKLAEPLMSRGGTLLTVTFYGSERVVENYNLMGPVKAALESATRYLAAELGPKGIRAHAISPGPIRTRAASGIARFDELLDRATSTTPERQLIETDDVGALAAFLVSDAARHITGTIIPVDGGLHLMA